MTKYLLQVTTHGVTHHYIVVPSAAVKLDPERHRPAQLDSYELCWADHLTGSIISAEPDWVISMDQLEEKLSP